MVGVFFDLNFELPPAEVHTSKVRIENGVMDGYFYEVPLDSRLNFHFPNFMVEILTNYGIASSQLVSNS